MAKREGLKAKLAVQSGKRDDTAIQPAASGSGYMPAPSRIGKVLLAIYCDPAVREQVRAVALRQQTTAQALVLRYINEGFERDGVKTIA